MLAAARCKYVAEGGWGSRRYLDTDLLNGWETGRCSRNRKASFDYRDGTPAGESTKDY